MKHPDRAAATPHPRGSGTGTTTYPRLSLVPPDRIPAPVVTTGAWLQAPARRCCDDHTVPHLEPGQALQALETALRSLLSFVFEQKFGTDWLEQVTKPEQIEAWNARASTEAARRGKRGIHTVPSAGLSYANLYELIKIADTHWEPLSTALGGDRKRALALLDRADQLRNSVAHNRPLAPFEQDLLAGIAGQTRNQVTLFMSAADPAGDIYPRIESIEDSFGRRIESATVDGELAGQVWDRDIVVHPGEQITFTCIGVDPQGRPLAWTLAPSHMAQEEPVIGPSGTPTSLVWTIPDGAVSEGASVHIFMSTHEARYRRFNSFDHRAYFNLIIRPPH